MKGERILRVKYDVLYYTVHVIFTESIVWSRSRRKHLGWPSTLSEGVAGHSYAHDDKYNSYIFLNYKTNPAEMVHEAYHAICCMFRRRGAEHEEEMFAYHLDHLVGKMHEFKDKIKLTAV